MSTLLWLIPTIPMVGFVVLALAGARLPRAAIASIGVCSIAASAVLALVLSGMFILSPPVDHVCRQTLWTWIGVDGFAATIGFYFDALALVMVLVVTFVGFLIHLYSAEFMAGDEGYGRYFAYMNLFVASMLVLLLADNLLLLYLGWEGVGLCSYLLIGFWYREPANGAAARKAFLVTRVGDTAMAIGLLLLFVNLGTLDIQESMQRAVADWPVGGGLAIAAAALLLGGALGKSAQLPLQTWLPDAMAGPTPVSALIHAATMVTAGVYLIARTHLLFSLAPPVQTAVAVIGAATLLLAGCSALTQWDIKRVLAYSTISQIGYMFLALGVGAWAAAILHFMVHAFFKALLFLGAGVVILALRDEHDMFKMGGLRKQLPVTFWTFLVASSSLAAVPVVTAGFYSKDMILFEAWSSARGSFWLWAAGLFGALLTSIYTFRMVFLAFFGPARQQVDHRPGWRIEIPLVVLAVLSVIGGLVEMPRTIGNLPWFSDFLQQNALPRPPATGAGVGTELALQIIAAVTCFIGIGLAYWWFLARPGQMEAAARSPLGSVLHRLWFADWGFDWLYDRLFVRPYRWLAEIDRDDFFDSIYTAVAWLTRALHEAVRASQTGLLRRYAVGIVIGALIALACMVWL